MAGQSLEIVCTACGAETLVKRAPKYDGFKKVGEVLACISCGHEYEDEAAVPFKTRKTLNLFSKDDLSPQVKVFREDEKQRVCRYCINYVVNPFTQRCTLRNNKIVESTDTCDQFEKRPQQESKAE